MFLRILGIYQDVVNEDNYELVKIRVKHPIHEVHKCSRYICQTKWHHQELAMPITSPKRCLGYISLFNLQLVVSRP